MVRSAFCDRNVKQKFPPNFTKIVWHYRRFVFLQLVADCGLRFLVLLFCSVTPYCVVLFTMARTVQLSAPLTGEELRIRYEEETDRKGCVLGITKARSARSKKWDKEHLPSSHSDTFERMSDEYFQKGGGKTVEGWMAHLGIEKANDGSFTVTNGMEFWAKETGTLNRNVVKGERNRSVFQYDREKLFRIDDYKTLFSRLKRTFATRRNATSKSPPYPAANSQSQTVHPRKRKVSMVFERMTRQEKRNTLDHIGQCNEVGDIAHESSIALRQCRHDIQAYFPSDPGLTPSVLRAWAESLKKDSDADHIEDCLDLLIEWCQKLHEGIVEKRFTISDVKRRMVMPDAKLNLQYVLSLSKYMTLFCSQNEYDKPGDHWDIETGRILPYMTELVDELDKVDELDVSRLKDLLRPEASPVYKT